ncbi:hypothetical protein CCP2SC5_880003 [Azospirillaceae bacterium]
MAAKRRRDGRNKKDDNAGVVCAICSDKYRKGFTRHHVSYDPEVIIWSCRPCHLGLHQNGKVWPNHPFKKKFPPDREPYEFARAVIRAYDDAYSQFAASKRQVSVYAAIKEVKEKMK